VRELAAERSLEALTGPRLDLGEPGYAAAVVEQAAGGFPVIARRSVHGTPSIVAGRRAANPWREGATESESAETR
jgi:hypothetical protein